MLLPNGVKKDLTEKEFAEGTQILVSSWGWDESHWVFPRRMKIFNFAVKEITKEIRFPIQVSIIKKYHSTIEELEELLT